MDKHTRILDGGRHQLCRPRRRNQQEIDGLETEVVMFVR